MTRNFEKNFPRKYIIKMSTKTVRELRSIAKDKDLRGYYKLKKDDLVALLLEQSAEEIPSPPPRSKGKKRRPVVHVKIIPSPQEIKNVTSKAFPRVKSSIFGLHDTAKKTLRGDVEGEARRKIKKKKKKNASI